jgi:hypothetical protein
MATLNVEVPEVVVSVDSPLADYEVRMSFPDIHDCRIQPVYQRLDLVPANLGVWLA